MARPSKATIQARRAAQQANTAPSPAPLSMVRTAQGTASTVTPDDDASGQDDPAPDSILPFDPLLTADQVAQWLGKPKATLYAWRTRGCGPRGIKVGSNLRYRRRDVETFLEQNEDPRSLT